MQEGCEPGSVGGKFQVETGGLEYTAGCVRNVPRYPAVHDASTSIPANTDGGGGGVQTVAVATPVVGDVVHNTCAQCLTMYSMREHGGALEAVDIGVVATTEGGQYPAAPTTKVPVLATAAWEVVLQELY
uniref:Crossover junction endodeoxyribonuclease RuvC n=1 Tax=Lygus hesperus TaxID=30085 RepID=A0A0A9XYQ2_LYGHE